MAGIYPSEKGSNSDSEPGRLQLWRCLAYISHRVKTTRVIAMPLWCGVVGLSIGCSAPPVSHETATMSHHDTGLEVVTVQSAHSFFPHQLQHLVLQR
jgi:hypothetical protein